MVRLGSVLLILLLGAAQVRGDGRNPFDDGELEAALEQGRVLPLSALLASGALGPGQVIEAELEREDGRWIYEIDILRPDGRVERLDLDAATLVPRAERERDND